MATGEGPRAIGWTLMAIMVLALAWCVWKVEYPIHQYLSNLPTAAFLVILPFLWRRRRLSDASLVQLTLFTLLHVVGTRWLYSCVPYEDWTRSLFGVGLNEWLGWERNHFDRLVHLAFGLLVTLPAAQFLSRGFGVGRGSALAVAVLAVFAVSAFYEIAEWLVTVVADPENAERYNGQQGDFFDAQKDMALAAIGSLAVALPAGFFGGRRRARAAG